ncbi:MAG: hypothetical protein WBV82_29155 [Myxococcaceae bacterium]
MKQHANIRLLRLRDHEQHVVASAEVSGDVFQNEAKNRGSDETQCLTTGRRFTEVAKSLQACTVVFVDRGIGVEAEAVEGGAASRAPGRVRAC